MTKKGGVCCELFSRKIIYYATIFFLIVILPHAASVSFPSEKDVSFNRFVEVMKFFSEERYSDAVRSAEDLIMETENFSSVYTYLCRSAKKAGLLSGVKVFFSDRLQKEPDNPYSLYGLGLCAEFENKPDQAFLLYAQSIRNGAGFIEVYVKYVDLAKKQKNLSSAMAFLKDRIDKHSHPAQIYYGLGYLGRVQNEWKDALLYTDQSLELNPDRLPALLLKGNILIYTNLYADAQKVLSRGLELAKKGSDKVILSQFYNVMGNTYYYQNDYGRAMEHYKEAARLSEETYNLRGQAIALGNTGLMNIRLGRYPEALVHCRKSLSLVQRIGFERLLSSSFSCIGIIYYETGDYLKALEFYKKSLRVNEELGDLYNLEGVCNEIGLAYQKLKDYEKALFYFEKGLEANRKYGNKRKEGITLGNIGNVFYELDQLKKAIFYCEQSLRVTREISYRQDQGYVHVFLGSIYLKQNNLDEALKNFERALLLSEEIYVPEIRWSAYHGMALCYEHLNNFDQALSYYRSSIDAIEELRGHLVTQKQKSAFLEDKIEIFNSLVNLLIKLHFLHPDQGYDRQAFHFTELSKARAFVDRLAEAKIDLTVDISPGDREREKDLLNSITKIQTELADNRISMEKRSALHEKLWMAEEDYESLRQEIRLKSPDYANLVYPEPRKVSDIQLNFLDPETALLEYVLAEDAAFVFLLTRERFEIHPISDGADLAKKVQTYIGLMSSEQKGQFPGTVAGHRLYKELVAPFAQWINGKKRLIIVPDGNLYYLPFETLVSCLNGASQRGKPRFFIEDLQISYAPSTTALINLSRRKKAGAAGMDFLGMGNPKFQIKSVSDKNVKVQTSEFLGQYYLNQGFHFFPLVYSAREVNKIAKKFPKKSRTILLGKDASEDNLKSIFLYKYRIIHFATHGLLDENVAGRSAIVLSVDHDSQEDGFFQVREVYRQRLGADLTVLSACQTRKGQMKRGEGVSGLARAFLYAGSDSVVVSLWSINDRSTAEFMQTFYQFLIQGRSKSEALRLAKINLLNSRFDHPFHWGAFVLIGDYKNMIRLSETQ